MQVLSRFLLVWGVVFPFPWLAQSPVYSSMLLAWSITEVIRYSYFALNLSGLQPKALVWLRYNTFFVLYPIGILSECTLVYMAAEPLKMFGELAPYISYIILAIYVPGMSAPGKDEKNPTDVRRILRAVHVHDEAEVKGHAQPQGRAGRRRQDQINRDGQRGASPSAALMTRSSLLHSKIPTRIIKSSPQAHGFSPVLPASSSGSPA
jgi:hypothetical protein